MDFNSCADIEEDFFCIKRKIKRQVKKISKVIVSTTVTKFQQQRCSLKHLELAEDYDRTNYHYLWLAEQYEKSTWRKNIWLPMLKKEHRHARLMSRSRTVGGVQENFSYECSKCLLKRRCWWSKCFCDVVYGQRDWNDAIDGNGDYSVMAKYLKERAFINKLEHEFRENKIHMNTMFSKLDDIKSLKHFFKKEIQQLKHRSVEINEQVQCRSLALYGSRIQISTPTMEQQKQQYTCDKCPKCRAPIISTNRIYDIEGTCIICLDEFTDPVMLYCGHCYCRECIIVL